ncbi:hypothetical protein [Chitinophaga deserti]|uniref:hypothetical protein n=1 Tax=Chitinophaga deserti TaxID=2164099 RepID=UPI000D6CB8F7|nr:hypothetical protein [Chitinophaga deserti]
MDHRLKKFIISFPKGWVNVSEENPDGPPTFINELIRPSGVLQISTAAYLSGELPDADNNTLLGLSRKAGITHDFGKHNHEESGNCRFGKYGFVQFGRPDFPYIAVWHLTNGKDFIFSTFICSESPRIEQVNDVHQILTTLRRKNIFGL